MRCLCFCVCVFLLLYTAVIHGLPSTIRIGALFNNQTDSKLQMAFRYAVDSVNTNNDLLPGSRLIAQMETIESMDSFHASKRVCRLLKMGTIAIFGPQSGQTSSHIQSICDAMSIPHIETRWDYRLRRDDYSVNLYPHPASLSQAYADLVKEWDWKSFTIIYQDNDGLVRLQELLKAPTPEAFKITVRQLPEGDDYRPLLKDIKKSGQTLIVLDCAIERLQMVLKQAQQIGMMTTYHSYIITSLDLHTVDLEDFQYSGTNISSLRLVDPNRPEVSHVVQNWMFNELRYGNKDIMSSHLLKTETALIYDAVHLFAKALTELDRSQKIEPKSLDCDGTDSWSTGNSLINYMKMVELDALTGLIKFDSEGFRTDFLLDIVQLSREGLKKIGTWNKLSGINITQTHNDSLKEIQDSLKNKTLIVTSTLSQPYFMLKESADKLTGNDQYEGYAVDLIAKIAESLGFNYQFQEVGDKKYGALDKKTGEWNGMIRELLDQKADLAIVDLTITYEREQAVDFTMPFMNLGISILYKKPQKKPPNLFSFLSPLSLDVWIYMATAYLGVSVILFVLARFSPYEWDNPHPCIEDPDVLENQFSILNSLWFTIGSLMQQGSDIAPKAVSTRMVAGIWWFFTLIMISSYTANLAAFLTVERMDSPIESAEDLAKQTKIKYGSVESGSTTSFFRDSKIATYQKMWAFMESARPSVFPKSNHEGVERVQKQNGQYAFLMESTSIEYIVERNCDLTQIGGLLDSKGYGIALPPRSPYRTPISSTILKLQEGGVLHLLKVKWWEKERGGGQCKDEESKGSGSANELGLANVGGVFVVLMGGMGIASIIAVCEFIWKSRKLATEEGADLCSEMASELKFALRCRGSTKPVRKKTAEESENGHFLPINQYSSGVQYGYVQDNLT